MKLSTAYARFYKSFNFDQVRKLNAKEKLPWDEFRGQNFPYIRVPLDPKITTIVGANESGKSHLLDAIKKAITGKDIKDRDHCRYSPFFGVAQGQRCPPHVGVGWDKLSDDEAKEIAAIVGASFDRFDRFLMFREEPDILKLWLPHGKEWESFDLGASAQDRLAAILPQPFEIKPDVAIPNAIPFAYILDGSAASLADVSRNAARQLLDSVPVLRRLAADPSQITANAQSLNELLQPALQKSVDALTENELASLDLGRRLLIELGKIDPDRLKDLARAVDESDDGYASGLLRKANEQLDRQLNLQRYWVQDRDFGLRVVIRHRELAFTITDRTGSEYMFSERSSGLRYFLSYLIQAQVDRPVASRETILLMDEPDTFLSAEAQQDLMRVFRDLADPVKDREPIQVIYVTHSPFLLDKNHGERIRVLEKGTISDGTRVVPTATQNHYEPLRSAFGAFVGETAFVGAVNVLVEGPSDQIILAAAATAIRKLSPLIEEDSLDLNRIVIVPSGSAGEVPHTLFRIRGQGADKPPTVILLDADAKGLEVKKLLLTDAMLKNNISSELVLDLASVGGGIDGWPAVLEIEDVVPAGLAHAAVASYVEEVMKFREGVRPEFSLAAIQAAIGKGGPLIDAINGVVAKSGGKIEKVGFAQAIARILEHEAPASLAGDLTLFLDRMRILFRAVNKARHQAEREAGTRRLDTLVEQRARLFKMDHPTHARREECRILLDEIEANLNLSVEADAIRNDILTLRGRFELDREPADPVEPYQDFLDGLAALKHAYRRRAGQPEAVDAPARKASEATKVMRPTKKPGPRKAKPASSKD
ncbi:AAA family ATPase [Sphingopyxis sp. BSN-002]|uniref:AAA family ATPase n=1 Tax=Sphingopyxis sp. BSN-002 TaxID=2911495 RepID=UPI001EDA728E|nr:AAA family ATPase [Sphingopyxis sp. BSN-002]UKK86186.1 AAA family ATPase [Sphingopyxis sp. BSN-002]